MTVYLNHLPPAIKKESEEMQMLESMLCKRITAQAQGYDLTYEVKKRSKCKC